ncbi:MAG: hypothetical protein KGM44_07385, partial [bacterium]|nr:hypothetical protein [bacterium]
KGASAWYESPHRIEQTLLDAAHAGVTRCFLLREYTKRHEQRLHGSPAEVAAALPEPVRGELVLIVAGGGAGSALKGAGRASIQEIDERIDALLAEGTGVAAIARALAAEGLGERRGLYARAAQRKAGTPDPHD